MERSSISVGRRRIPLTICSTVVVGSGAAGFNAADRLYENGETDVLLVTEGVNMGTSRNTGSDKQTYYKLTLCGDGDDSVEEMARTLHSGKCVDGDTALVEAALSSRCFYRLVELDVPFPQNPYGEFAGYKTDHDPRARATSVGPLTSKEMTERLEQAVRRRGILIAGNLLVVRVLTHHSRAAGLLCGGRNLTAAPSARARWAPPGPQSISPPTAPGLRTWSASSPQPPLSWTRAPLLPTSCSPAEKTT